MVQGWDPDGLGEKGLFKLCYIGPFSTYFTLFHRAVSLAPFPSLGGRIGGGRAFPAALRGPGRGISVGRAGAPGANRPWSRRASLGRSVFGDGTETGRSRACSAVRALDVVRWSFSCWVTLGDGFGFPWVTLDLRG